MAVHTIMLPIASGPEFADDLRSIIWDDEAGTVEGDHPGLEAIAWALAADKPVLAGSWIQSWTLSDPGHDPAEFLSLLYAYAIQDVIREPLRSTLPDVFDGVDMPRSELGEYAPNSMRLGEDGRLVPIDQAA